jgi:hypothetical protein
MKLASYNDRIDLSIERDSGNEVLILMGKPEYALVNWQNLQSLCNQAIKELTKTVKGELRQWKEPPIESGLKRAYTVCGTCGKPYYYDYVPFGLSSNIITLSCGHGMTEHRSGLKDVPRETFIILKNKQERQNAKTQ